MEQLFVSEKIAKKGLALVTCINRQSICSTDTLPWRKQAALLGEQLPTSSWDWLCR